jgi:LysR family nitrogen assimilation transcriptional regulator
MLDLKELDCFARVAETGSLTRTAAALDTSHSSLSRTLQQLEQRLGQRLFRRTGRGVVLTEFGRALLPRAQRLLVDASRLGDEAAALAGRPSGKVVVGLPGSIAALIAAPLFRSVEARHPLISVRLVEGLSGTVEELLLLGRVDVGLYYSDRGRWQRGDTPLAVNDLCLVGRRGDSITAGRSVSLAQVARCPLSLPSQPHALRAIVEEACAKAGLQPRVPYEVDSLSTMKAMVRSGQGYTVSTYDAVAQDVGDGKLQAARIIRPALARLLVMRTAPKHSLTIAARAVATLTSGLIEQLVKEGKWQARLPEPGKS